MPMGRSALVYDSGSRELILRFKHGDQLHLTPLFSRWLYAAGHDFWADTHLIMPVPLHWRRRFSRRYNQAAVLAQATATIAGLPVDTISLQRQRHTPPQKGHSQASRTANVADAFLVKNATAVTGKNIVLVDDVWTTGATLTACTHVLQACGAKNVRWLTLARVLPKSLQNTYSHIAEEAI